jgi:molybdopterin biosynthesis enzyme
MNMFIKAASIALLASGVTMSGAAMAANQKPVTVNDSCTVTGTDTSACDGYNVLDNDTNADKVKPVVVANTKFGKVKIAADGSVTFTMKGATPKPGQKLVVAYKAWNKHGVKPGRLEIVFKAEPGSDES